MDKNTNSSRKCDTGGISVVQAEYKKEWMDTYLWILSEKDTEASYEEKMINVKEKCQNSKCTF